MPRTEHVLTVFVASPSDVGGERTRLEEVIRELNITWSRILGVRLELVRWETHAYPGKGDDAQDVINEQIPEDYDLFVGIMWCRYGTPTGRSGSGTVEEFERAKARYDADSSSVKLMVYFKDEAIPPSQLDPTQLSKVNEFRISLGDEGVLYWKFKSIDQFEKLIRLHLTRQVQAWKAQFRELESSAVQNESAEQPGREPEAESQDDLGVLDLVEIFEDRFVELGNISERISEATEDLAEKMTRRTKQIEKLPRDLQGIVNPKDAKRLISRAAVDMEQYTARIDAELPLFSDALNTGMTAFIRCVSMFMGLDAVVAHAEQAKEGLEAIVSLQATFAITKESLSEFRQSTHDLPPMTSKLNKAKRSAVSVIDRLIAQLDDGLALLREAETSVRDLLGDGEA